MRLTVVLAHHLIFMGASPAKVRLRKVMFVTTPWHPEQSGMLPIDAPCPSWNTTFSIRTLAVSAKDILKYAPKYAKLWLNAPRFQSKFRTVLDADWPARERRLGAAEKTVTAERRAISPLSSPPVTKRSRIVMFDACISGTSYCQGLFQGSPCEPIPPISMSPVSSGLSRLIIVRLRTSTPWELWMKAMPGKWLRCRSSKMMSVQLTMKKPLRASARRLSPGRGGVCVGKLS